LNDLELLIDLHIDAERQGPGSKRETELALKMAVPDNDKRLKIADIGCGTGASTLHLAKLLNADITAVDLFDDFLSVLVKNAEKEGVSEKVTTLAASMEDLPFEESQFDLLWSEGAVYNIGFENAVSKWQNYLKPEGILAVSEITWLTNERPAEIDKFWTNAYPEISTASDKIKILESSGYTPTGYFTLPEYCWLENYYLPIENRLEQFLKKHPGNESAEIIAKSEVEEIALYKKYKQYYSYGFYIAKKNG